MPQRTGRLMGRRQMLPKLNVFCFFEIMFHLFFLLHWAGASLDTKFDVASYRLAFQAVKSACLAFFSVHVMDGVTYAVIMGFMYPVGDSC